MLNPYITTPEERLIWTIGSTKFPEINVKIKMVDTQKEIQVDALLDSGATGLYVDATFIKENGLNTQKLVQEIPVYNVDGTRNNSGSIKEMIDFHLEINGHKERASFAVCGLGKKTIIIGEAWLKQHNPSIDCTRGRMEFSRCPSSCGHTIQEIHEDEERIFMIMIDYSVSINSVAQDLAIEEEKKKVKKP